MHQHARGALAACHSKKKPRAKERNPTKLAVCGPRAVIFAKHISSAPN